MVFKATAADTSRLATKIEKKLLSVFGFAVPVIVRTPNELLDLIQNNLFLKGSGNGCFPAARNAFSAGAREDSFKITGEDFRRSRPLQLGRQGNISALSQGLWGDQVFE